MGSDVVVIFNVAGTIVRVRLTFAICAGELKSVTLNVSAAALAVAVGIPLIVPVDAFNVKPFGSVPEMSAQVYGVFPPLAANV
jgi:hypothetical protein